MKKYFDSSLFSLLLAAVLLSFAGCTTPKIVIPELPEYTASGKTYDTSALIAVMDDSNPSFAAILREKLRQEGYKVYSDADYYSAEQIRPDWIIIPTHVEHRKTYLRDGSMILDVRALIIVRKPGAVSNELLRMASVSGFQAWARSTHTPDDIRYKVIDGKAELKIAVDNLFLIDKFRETIIPDRYYRNIFLPLVARAAKGNRGAALTLFNIYCKGNASISPNYSRALYWGAKALPSAGKELAASMDALLENQPIDDYIRMYVLPHLTDAGLPNAQYYTALDYLENQNRIFEAYDLLRKASRQNHTRAMFVYGKNLIDSRKNISEGISYMEKSAINGYKPAISYLILLYQEGKFVPVDLTKKAFWEEKLR